MVRKITVSCGVNGGWKRMVISGEAACAIHRSVAGFRDSVASEQKLQ